jgi:Ca2+-transporting ATPase
MAAKGLRVLAFARGELPAGTTDLTHAHVTDGLIFLGLQGLSDPPRPEAVAAVHACQSAGIRVKMITGDHALTASAIAQQIGLDGADEIGETAPAVLTGKAMADLSDAELIEAAERTAVFARVTPEQKLRLVEALQAHGHIVAMTGDGVNDAPALKQSDIGVAMGKNGTDVAKEAADMVLTDDNFASIEAAVEEGRGVFDNLTKIIAWTLPTNLGEGLVVLAAIVAGVALPILPAQILWINMTTVAVLGLVLAMEDKEFGIMHRPPRDPRSPILTGELIWRILVVGALILVGAFGLFAWELSLGASLSEARTVAVNVVVLVEMFYLFNCRSLTQSMFRIGVFSNRWLVVGWVVMLFLQLLFTYAPFMNSVMASAPIPLDAWWRILSVSIITYIIIEFEKWVRQQMPVSKQGRGLAVSPKACAKGS